MNSTSETLQAQMSGKPVVIVWGTADVLFGEDVVLRWQMFPHAEVRRVSESGHFVPEDARSSCSATSVTSHNPE
jgi:pimeloyl-ACP methyl ester carboxylesterase